MYIHELQQSGIREIILQSQSEQELFAIVELYNDYGTFDADYEGFANRIKNDWGGYFYISSTDAINNKNKVYLD